MSTHSKASSAPTGEGNKASSTGPYSMEATADNLPMYDQTTICISGHDISEEVRHNFVLKGKARLVGKWASDSASSWKLSAFGNALRKKLVVRREVANLFQEDESQFQENLVEDIGKMSGLTDDISVHYVSQRTMEGLREEDGWEEMPAELFADVSDIATIRSHWRKMQLACTDVTKAE